MRLPWIVLLLPLACARAAPVTLPHWNLQLTLPAAWTIPPAEAAGTWLARPARDGDWVAGAYFSVIRDDARPGAAPPQLPEYAAFKERQAAKLGDAYRRDSPQPTLLDGVAALEETRSYSFRGTPFRALAVTAVRDGHGYQFVGAARAVDFAALEPEYRRILGSIRWMP